MGTAEHPKSISLNLRYGHLGLHPHYSSKPSLVSFRSIEIDLLDLVHLSSSPSFLHEITNYIMGINPDAYMSGAIPGLSRGGSWQNVQDPYPSPLYAKQQGGRSIYPRPSNIVPPGSSASHGQLPQGNGNRSNSHFAHHHHHPQHHPWAMNCLPTSPLSNVFAPSYQQSYFGGIGNGSQGSSTGYSPSGKAPSVGQIRHPGWTNLNGQYIGAFSSTPSSPSAHTPSRSKTNKQPPPSVNAAQLQSPSSASGLSIQQQYEWEWASGSPKPMTAEPDYFNQSPHNEKYKPAPTHDMTPPPSAGVMNLRLPPKKTKMVEALPPPPQSGRLRHESMRQTQGQAQRPMPHRRHTHDRFSPEDNEGKASRHDSKSLGRQRRKERDVGSVAGESYYAPSKSSSMPRSHHPASSHSHSPRAGSRRTESLLSCQVRASSLTERRLKQSGRPVLPTIVSNSTVDFTSPDPSVVQSARPDRSAFDLSNMADALPPAPITATPGPYTATVGGYAPTEEEEDDYDRYMARPAAPTPLRNEAVPKTAPPLRMDLKIVKPEDYRPPAFPAPTKPRPWNRDGPAMKTHGVAWGREAPEGQLPTGPAGPRWAQARPPRLDLQQTGNWWESGVG